MSTAFQIIQFPLFDQPKGLTVPIEFGDEFPFEVKRVYLFTGVPGQVRGGHAHTIEEEVFLCLHGSCAAVLHDGKKEHKIVLDSPEKALYVSTGCWHEFVDFSPSCTLLALSSTPFLPGENNYLTDRSAFWKEST